MSTTPATELRKVPGTLARVLRKVVKFDDYGFSYTEEVPTANVDNATVVSSILKGTQLHAPVLDLDVPVTLVPSSTPGHSHLYIDVPMSRKDMERILRALAKAGVVEPAYYEMSKRRGYTCVRLPWIKKETTAS
jgi:hypothetical protein